jgi:dTDP-glucose 4,6-dehydratase
MTSLSRTPARVLLTGAGGFVGSHVLRHLLMHTDWYLVCPVTFRHKGNPDRISSAFADHPEWEQRINVLYWDMVSPATCTQIDHFGPIDYILNVASDSHVDRSLTDPVPFVMGNTALILNVLELARELNPKLFLQMSTDEVYGPAYGDHRHAEWETIAPSNPYSASKACQEAICITYWRAYGVPVVITNTMNIIGEMQDAEKFIPKTISAILEDRPMTVHCDSKGRPGSRFYLHARNLAAAWLWLILNEGKTWDLQQYADGSTRPQRFNVVGEREVDNIEMVNMIGEAVSLTGVVPKDRKPIIERVDFHGTRPGHDRRYALDGTKLQEIGWIPPIPLEASLRRSVAWTLAHPEWLC